MKTLRFSPRHYSHDTGYPEDILRMQAVCINNGYGIGRLDCQRIWEEHSETFCAGWLMMEGYTDLELWDVIQHYTTED